MKRAARVESYRGFVFASLAADGPSLVEFLGRAKIAFDDMCDRSPEGEVEVVPNCFRVIQHSNWKFFLENQLDALHPSVTHQSTGRAAGEVEKAIEEDKAASAPLYYHFLSAFATSRIEQVGRRSRPSTIPTATASSPATWACGRSDPDTLDYEKVLKKAYGKKRMEEILGVNIHHVLVYPGPLGAVAAAAAARRAAARRRQDADRDLAFPPEGRARGDLPPRARLLQPRQLAGDDDQRRRPGEFWKCHQGLASDGGDWVSFHRHFGQRPRGRTA